MHTDVVLKCAFAGFVLLQVSTAFSQVRPAASRNELPLSAGAGLSSYNVDWGHGRMEGATVWVDLVPNRMPPLLSGIGIEAEYRNISFGRSSTQPKNFRLATAGGGVTYSVRRFQYFRPYGKYLVSVGGIDWNNPNPHFIHETRLVTAPGLGVEFRVARNVWIRADYEYQFWPDLLKNRPASTHVLNPQGFTLGAMYSLKPLRRR